MVIPARTQEPRLQENSQTRKVTEAQCKSHDAEINKVIKGKNIRLYKIIFCPCINLILPLKYYDFLPFHKKTIPNSPIIQDN